MTTPDPLTAALDALGYDRSIFDRRSWMEGNTRRSCWKRRGLDASRRAEVWNLMRKPRGGVVMSYPDIARACGSTCHSCIIAALAQLRARGPVVAMPKRAKQLKPAPWNPADAEVVRRRRECNA